ncbi:MAG TPA: formimidoylglutamate deiminase [Enhygromyxa sp.]|nr:formimidoylglutamate deiminase [Enhygromyxa sp.]
MSEPSHATVTAALAWVELDDRAQLVHAPRIRFDRATGIITAIELDDAAPRDEDGLVYDLGRSLLIPGMINAHSHAFQRAIRGATHRRTSGDPSSFWSWREAMYATANALEAEDLFLVTAACFAEMLRRGITCVGEFHYLHLDRDGRPYADPNELSLQIIRAAEHVGLRLCLLEVYYARAGFGHDGPLPEQRRFCDGSIDAYLRRVDDLRALAAGRQDTLRIGVAPHSVRAVRAVELGALAAYAERHELPIHAHVSEQPLENQQCFDEYARTPLEVFTDAGCLARPHAFTAVHAIHVDERDLQRLRGQQVCACPTTEADLGDGIVPAAAWRDHEATLALGSDSNAIIDLVQEARLLEMHERLHHQSRLRLIDDEGRVAPVLLAAATTGGAQALARPELGRLAIGSPFDAVVVDLEHPLLRGVPDSLAIDALLLAGTAEPITQVWIGGKRRI